MKRRVVPILAEEVTPGMTVVTGPGPGKRHTITSVQRGPSSVMAKCAAHSQPSKAVPYECLLCWEPGVTVRVVSAGR
ncbi:protein of unknown function [Streptomyces murinus]|uniref:hypothetical protein n=1 Tax=Streptomyces murinus TaxID=33900 RepID=UPI003D66ECD3